MPLFTACQLVFPGVLAQWGHSYSIGCWLFNHLQAFGNFGKEGGAGSFGFQYAVLQDRDGIFRRLHRGEAAEPVIEQLVPCCIKLACLAVPVLPAAVPPAGLAAWPMPSSTTLCSMLRKVLAVAASQTMRGAGS